MEAAVAEALECGAFSAKVFPCDAPLHTPLMEAVAESLREIVCRIPLSRSRPFR